MKLAICNSRDAKPLGNLARSFFLFATALLSLGVLRAQSSSPGLISGTVVDADYGGPVLNASVTIAETQATSKSNMDGKYLLSDVPSGTYTLVVSAAYYKATRVENVAVEAGKAKTMDIPLRNDEDDVIELETFVFEAEELENSDVGLLIARRKSPASIDAIGSESFSRLGLSDAADAINKVVGVSVQDGKYAVVRGLSDRYNQTTLNGSSVPSADPDKRAVQLDQFPAGIIDSISTVKTFTPDLSANFTGGYVDIKTKAIPDRFFLTVNAGVEYNDNTTFRNILSYPGGSDDWLGKDDGTRALPEIVRNPNELPNVPIGLSDEEKRLLDQATLAFTPNLVPTRKEAPLNHKFGITFGDRIMLGESPDGPTIGIIGALNYKRKLSAYRQGQTTRYEWAGGDNVLPIKDFTEESGVDTADWGTVLNVAFQPSGSHEIGLNSTYTQSGHDEAIFRSGLNQETVGRDTFNIRNLHFTERTLKFNQLYGKHTFDDLLNARVNWMVSKSSSLQSEPDFRLFYDTTPFNPERGSPTYTGNFPAPRRYWRDLDEENNEYKLDITLPIGGELGDIKFGLQNIDVDRTFTEKGFLYRDNARVDYQGDAANFLHPLLLGLSPDGNVRRYIASNPTQVPEYNGQQSIQAYYLMADLSPIEKWRFVFGARNESTDIDVQSFDARGNAKGNDGDIDVDDWHPAFSSIFEATENSTLRFSYAKTQARPNFRELSPFGSFDNVGGENFVGNPNLERTLIDNYDIRYEWFPTDSELVAVSAFYKKLENPIEQNFVRAEQSYVNVPEGEVSGLELETRKRLNFIGGERQMVTVGGNLSFIESEVQRSANEIDQKDNRDLNVSPTRELQGQSALIGNLDIGYENLRSGTAATLVYNHTGESLYSVTLAALPDIYTAPSDSLDLILSQRLPKNYSMRLAFRNLLNDKQTRYLPIAGNKLIYSQYDTGLTVSLSFSYRFE